MQSEIDRLLYDSEQKVGKHVIPHIDDSHDSASFGYFKLFSAVCGDQKRKQNHQEVPKNVELEAIYAQDQSRVFSVDFGPKKKHHLP
jgi:hypothetical protein